MSPLAEAVYSILRSRPGLPDPRITYAELALQLRTSAELFEHITHRSRELYAALSEVGEECARLELPCLAALVVRADSRRPGDAYFQGMPFRFPGERYEAWRQELEAVNRTEYPPRTKPTPARGTGEGMERR
jgi:hypothetical protein